MPRVEKSVFISYRRTNFPWALNVYQDLTYHGYDVFFDFEGIGSGDFESIIVDNIISRAHFLILLTPSALERCAEPGDWLRREIEVALGNQRNIVPLMLEGFSFTTPNIASQLTGTLASLKTYNGLSMPAEYFLAAMDKLRSKFLNVPLTAVLQPATYVAREAADAQKAAANAAPPAGEEELTAQQYFERGVATNDPEEEIRFNTEAIRLKPNYAEAYNNRAVARKKLGDLEGAIGDLDQALAIRPEFIQAYNNREIALEAKELLRARAKIEAAITRYTEAIRLQPDHAETYNFRAKALNEKGDWVAALADLDRAIRLRPDFAEAYNNRAGLYSAKGDSIAALRDYDEALSINPKYAEALYNRAELRKTRDELDNALDDYDRIIQLEPLNYEAFYERAVVRQAKGNYVGAISDCSQAIKLKWDYAEAFKERATLFGLENQPDRQEEDLRQFLRLWGLRYEQQNSIGKQHDSLAH